MVLVVAACAPGAAGTRVTRVEYGSGNPTEYLTYLAARDPDVRTIVVGPERLGTPETAATVTAAMNAYRAGPRVRYTTAPEAEANPGYRVVMALGAEPILGQRLCRTIEDDGKVATEPDRAAIQAAFCYREQSLSEAYVEVASLAGPDDPNLRAGIAALMYRLFPLQLPPDNGPECPFGPFC
jgi:hypothetical protein